MKSNKIEATPEIAKVLKTIEEKVKHRKQIIMKKYEEIAAEMQAITNEIKQTFIDAGADEKAINKSFKKYELKNEIKLNKNKKIPADLDNLINIFK